MADKESGKDFLLNDYEAGYQKALKEVGEYIDKQHDILAEDLGYRLAFLDGLAEALKRGELPE